MTSAGLDPERKAPPRALPRVCARWIVPALSAVLAPAGTEVFRHPRALRWPEWPPRFRPDRLLVWNSLEERADVREALAEIRSALPPGGVLEVVASNAAAFPARLLGGGSLWEPQRQRVLFTPGLLASLLREAGFRNGKLRYSPAGLKMRAEAVAP